MKYIKKFNEGIDNVSPEEIMHELTLPLSDAGLQVKITRDDIRFRHLKNSLFVNIEDVNKLFCKKWPRDDMDWLNDKPIIKQFLKDIKDSFGLKQDIDYKMYGGGPSVTLVFDKSGMKNIRL